MVNRASISKQITNPGGRKKMAKRRTKATLKVVDLIKKFAGEKGKKAAEKKFGKAAVEAAQATVSKRKIVSKPNKKPEHAALRSYPHALFALIFF